MTSVRKVLVADPDLAAVRALTRALRQKGYQVHSARDGARALELAVLRHPDLVLFDRECTMLEASTFIDILRTNPAHRHHPGGGDLQRRRGGRGAARRAGGPAPQALQPRRGPGPHRRPPLPRGAGPERGHRPPGDRRLPGPARASGPAPDPGRQPPHGAGDPAPRERAGRGGPRSMDARRMRGPARRRERRRSSASWPGPRGTSPSSRVRPRRRARIGAIRPTSCCSMPRVRSTRPTGSSPPCPSPTCAGSRSRAPDCGRCRPWRGRSSPGWRRPGRWPSSWIWWRSRTWRCSRRWRCSMARGWSARWTSMPRRPPNRCSPRPSPTRCGPGCSGGAPRRGRWWPRSSSERGTPPWPGRRWAGFPLLAPEGAIPESLGTVAELELAEGLLIHFCALPGRRAGASPLAPVQCRRRRDGAGRALAPDRWPWPASSPTSSTCRFRCWGGPFPTSCAAGAGRPTRRRARRCARCSWPTPVCSPAEGLLRYCASPRASAIPCTRRSSAYSSGLR